MESIEFSESIIQKYTDEFINSTVEEIRKGIDIRDRKYHFKKYTMCFVGSDLVNWLIKNGHAANEAEAVEIGNYFIEKHVFHHVHRDHSFKNTNLFYRFDSDSKNRGHCLPGDSWNKVLEDKDGEILLPEDIPEVLANETDWHIKNPEHLPEILLDEFNRKTLDNCRPIKWVDPDYIEKYDLIAIGAGAGGLVSAIGAALSGGKAAIIERNLTGGDCLNTGCVPSKTFIKSAKIAHNMKNSKEFGISITGEIKVDFGKVMERVREIRAEISENDSVYKLAKKYGIDVYLGHAKFYSKHEIQINNKLIQFSKVCIATGGSPKISEIEGLSDFPYFTSENIFNLTEQPMNLIIIGSGPIGCELGQSFARLGTKVTIISRSSHILPKEDSEATQYLHQQMVDDGVAFKLKCKPIKLNVINSPGKIWTTDSKITLEVESDGATEIIEGDSILLTVGRKPNVHGLGLEAAGIEFDEENGIKIDDYCRTTNTNVYAVGDVCSKFQFTHNSDQMARNVVRNALFFGKEKLSKVVMSWVTYTDPEIAHIGKHASELDAEQIQYDTYKINYDKNDRAICESTDGCVKIYTKKGTDKILGATIVGGPAGDMICNISSAIYNKIGLSTLGSCIHPYPTYAEIFKALTTQYNIKKLGPTAKTALRAVLTFKK